MLLHPLNDDAEQAERPTTRSRRIHYLTGWPQTMNDRESWIVCRAEEGDWNTDESEVTCPDCLLLIAGDGGIVDRLTNEYAATAYRRAEIDRWLKEIGAQVIQVEHLGAALEAGYYGSAAISMGTVDQDGRGHLDVVGCWPVCSKSLAARAAHLARVALGEA